MRCCVRSSRATFATEGFEVAEAVRGTEALTMRREQHARPRRPRPALPGHRRADDAAASPRLLQRPRARAHGAGHAARQGHRARSGCRRLHGQALRTRGAAGPLAGATPPHGRSEPAPAVFTIGALVDRHCEGPRDLGGRAGVADADRVPRARGRCSRTEAGSYVTRSCSMRSGANTAEPGIDNLRVVRVAPPPEAPRRRRTAAPDRVRARARLPMDRRTRTAIATDSCQCTRSNTLPSG